MPSAHSGELTSGMMWPVDGIHDLGGMHGFGRVERDEVVFHAPWERRAFGLVMATPIDGNTDDFRHAIERLDPALYLSAGYHGRWLAALEVRLRERGLLDSDDVDRRGGRAARPSAVAAHGGIGHRPRRHEPDRPIARPRFAAGDRVRTRDLHPAGHTRLPRYARGREGVVTRVHPPFPFPDTVAHGLGEDPQPLYGVTFLAATLWGEGDHRVTLDLFEPYLEAA